MDEPHFVTALRRLPPHAGAAGLADDAAIVAGLVVTTDTLVAGTHFLPDDPPADIAWKLVAQNLSDLAAKGATPEGVLLNYPLSEDAWDRAFLAGFDATLRHFACPLIGGDTVSLPVGTPRVLTLTAIGRPGARVPRRDGARAGDALWVTGTIGDAGAGLAIARGDRDGPAALLDRYRRPQPRLAEGRALAPIATAMMDVSDGLLIDAARLAAASGLAVTIELSTVPLSPALIAFAGDHRDGRLAAAVAGDDYELLAALPAGVEPPVAATRIGALTAGNGLALIDHGAPVALPARIGFVHSGL